MMAFRGLRHHARCVKQIQDLFHTPNNVFSRVLPHLLATPCSFHMSNSPIQNNSTSSTCFGNPSRHLHTSSSHSAGHSKWSNIKHIKGAQDKARGEKSNALARKLQLALIKNPDTNPKLNTELATLIKWARSNNIPNDVIDRAVQRAVQLRNPANLTVFDGRGPSNIAIVLECMTLKPQHTKGLLQGVVKKYGFNLNSSASDLFDQKGIIEAEIPQSELSIALKDPDNFPLDKYVDIAIEAGAEDVTLQPDADNPYLEFTCAPELLDKTQVNIDKAGLLVTSSERQYIPSMLIPASDEYLQSLEVLKEKLDKHADVMSYHMNIVPES